MAVFVATDRVQHHFWPHEGISAEHPDWTPIRSLYQQIDSFLSDALELVDENTTVLVVSDHGFGPAYFAKRALNALFAQLGLLRYRQGRGRLQGRLLKTLLRHGRRIIPFQLQDLLVRALPRLHIRAVSEDMYSGIEWSQTQVFAPPHGGQVFVNLQGREPEGTVSPEDYHAVCERVREILLNLTDPTTGRRLVRAVHWREDIYHGPYVEQAADLLIEWEDELVGDSLCYRVDGEPVIVQTPKGSGPGERWTGGHRPQGIFIAHGPHIKRGAAVANASIYDVAPTILHLQGHPIPGDMDGKVLTDIFTEEQLRQHPVQQGEPASVGARAAEAVLDVKEARKIEKRLRGLGYIE
ncbi:MAG: alkaline phosphatase family protein [Anaerolineae bacterium]|nr:MAG: alkaline phosphatase family protein [Anaerolineae bacterium]